MIMVSAQLLLLTTNKKLKLKDVYEKTPSSVRLTFYVQKVSKGSPPGLYLEVSSVFDDSVLKHYAPNVAEYISDVIAITWKRVATMLKKMGIKYRVINVYVSCNDSIHCLFIDRNGEALIKKYAVDALTLH